MVQAVCRLLRPASTASPSLDKLLLMTASCSTGAPDYAHDALLEASREASAHNTSSRHPLGTARARFVAKARHPRPGLATVTALSSSQSLQMPQHTPRPWPPPAGSGASSKDGNAQALQ